MSQTIRCLLACTLTAYGLSSCSIRLPVTTPKQPHQQPTVETVRQPVAASASHVATTETVRVWLIADKFHTGMVFSYPWLIDSGFIPPKDFPSPRYVVMSWGNTDAYSEDGIGGPVHWLEVLFTPTESVMELIPVNWDLVEVLPHQRIWTNEVAAARGPHLAHFLNQCSKPNSNGTPVVVRPSSWGEGVQLQSNFSYFIPRVCNVWSLQAIEALGGDIHLWSALTADGLIRQIEKPANGFRQISNGID